MTATQKTVVAFPGSKPAPIRKIVLEVRGGAVQAIYVDNVADYQISIIDHDNQEWDRDAYTSPIESLDQYSGDGYRFA